MPLEAVRIPPHSRNAVAQVRGPRAGHHQTYLLPGRSARRRTKLNGTVLVQFIGLGSGCIWCENFELYSEVVLSGLHDLP